jgi:hypothetical protein
MSRFKVLPMSCVVFVTYVPDRFRIQLVSAIWWQRNERVEILPASISAKKEMLYE